MLAKQPMRTFSSLDSAIASGRDPVVVGFVAWTYTKIDAYRTWHSIGSS